MSQKMSEPNEVDLYLEAHVTIEPVFGEDRDFVAWLAANHGFKLAHLLMQKDRRATAERSNRDTFMTGHSKFCDDIIERTKALVNDLRKSGFKVWRYKIENTMLDSRNADVWGFIGDDVPSQPPSMCDSCRR